MSEAGARLRAALADRYRLERELGAGGMARRAVGRHDGRSVGAR
jgi:hypothetical protein